VNAYRDGARHFEDLLRAANGVVGLCRIRYTTSHPLTLRTAVFDAMAECDKVCEFLHLPVQAGSDRILKAMRRGYTAGEYLEKIAEAAGGSPVWPSLRTSSSATHRDRRGVPEDAGPCHRGGLRHGLPFKFSVRRDAGRRARGRRPGERQAATAGGADPVLPENRPEEERGTEGKRSGGACGGPVGQRPAETPDGADPDKQSRPLPWPDDRTGSLVQVKVQKTGPTVSRGNFSPARSRDHDGLMNGAGEGSVAFLEKFDAETAYAQELPSASTSTA